MLRKLSISAFALICAMQPAMAKITLVYTDQGTASASVGTAFLAFAEKVTELTDGEVQFEYFWGGALTPGPETLQAVGSGMADITVAPYVYWPQLLPTSNWTSDFLSNGQYSLPHFGLAQSLALNELFTTAEPIVNEWHGHGVVPLALVSSSPYVFSCTQPAETLADLQGRRIRTAGAPFVAEAEALGMVALSLPTGDIYDGLQRGIVDCISLALAGMVDWGFIELAPHILMAPSTGTAAPLVINRDRWDSLSPEIQAAMREAAGVFLSTNLHAEAGGLARVFGEGGKGGPGTNVTLHPAAEIREGVQAHHQRIWGALAAKAPASIENPEEILAVYQERLDYWRDMMREDFGIADMPLDLDSEGFRSYLAEVSQDPALHDFINAAVAEFVAE